MFRRIFGRKPKPPSTVEEKELSLDSIESEINRVRDAKLGSVRDEMRPLVEEISVVCEDIRASAKILAQAEASKEVYVGLDKSSREARRLFVDKVTHAIGILERSKELTWPSLLAFDDSLNRTISQLTGAGVVHGRFASVLFGQHFQNVYQSIHKLQELGAQFRAAIEVKKDEVRLFDDIDARITHQRDLAQKLVNLRSQKQELENQAKSLEGVIKAESGELDKLMSSQELKDAEKIRHELGQIEQKIARLRGEAASALSSFQRPFKKMKKLALDGKYPLSRDKLLVIGMSIEEPLKAFLSDEVNLPKLMEVLNEAKKSVESGEVELNPRERKKRLAQIERMLDGRLIELRQMYEKALLYKAAKEEAYTSSHVLKKRTELEKSLRSLRSDQEKIQSELKELSMEMERIEEEFKRNKSELEPQASIVLGIKLKIA
jgi:hypothetical protein